MKVLQLEIKNFTEGLKKKKVFFVPNISNRGILLNLITDISHFEIENGLLL